MARKKYDPLWEILKEKAPLQGVEEDVDARCPFCHVVVHVGSATAPGRRVECGLCGTQLEVVKVGQAVELRRVGET